MGGPIQNTSNNASPINKPVNKTPVMNAFSNLSQPGPVQNRSGWSNQPNNMSLPPQQQVQRPQGFFNPFGGPPQVQQQRNNFNQGYNPQVQQNFNPNAFQQPNQSFHPNFQ